MPPFVKQIARINHTGNKEAMLYPNYIENDYRFPSFFKVRMNFSRPRIDNIPGAILNSLDEALAHGPINAGDTVAVGIGSRGIANLPLIVKTVCTRLIEIGAKPVIIPAMGSHGGATAAGQHKILEELGVTKTACAAPIKSTMDTAMIGKVFDQVPVYFASDALAMDHCICINRIKPHSKFKAVVESGIYKMLCVGMGKHAGALAYHKWSLKYGFYPLLEAMGSEIIEKTNFRFGIGVVENAFDETMAIKALPAHGLLSRESRLLETAKQNMPALPFKQLDVLVIQYIGKEISGAGMDPNITGRAFDLKEDDFSKILKTTRMAVLNLSSKGGGNGIGLGNADIITEKVFQNLNYESTIMNALTSISLRKAFIPVRLPDDRMAIQACFTTIGPINADDIRAVILKDTLHTVEFLASKALREELETIEHAQILEKTPLVFDEKDNIVF